MDKKRIDQLEITGRLGTMTTHEEDWKQWEMEWTIWHECQHEILYYRNGNYLIGQCKNCGYIQTMRLYNAELDDDWTEDDSP